MSCTNPLIAHRLYVDATGKNHIKILPRMSYQELIDRHGKDDLILLPCGHCPSCLAKRSKEWAVRCALEALDHEENCFVTLTYSPEEYAKKDLKNDWKKFIKSLRNHDIKVRYFGCCEAGDENGRYHFHILLFGYFPKDVKPWAKSQKGFVQYQSKMIDDCWNKGLAVVSEFSPFCAQYTAGYVVKKFALGDRNSFHFQSTRPGIGAGYVLRNMQDIYDEDKLILSFGSHKFSVPRYFDKLAANCALDISDVKANRMVAASISLSQEMRDIGARYADEVLVHREDVALSKLRFQKRRF